MNLTDNKIYIELKKRDSIFINKIDDLHEHVYSILPKMNNIFDNYTEHGIDHSLRVLNYSTQLINDITILSDLELTIIIYVALLHDIGMVVSEIEKNNLTDDSVNELGMKYSAIKKKFQNNEKKALQEYFRPVHGIRSFEYIKKMENQNLFCVTSESSFSFGEEVGKICMSHNESVDWIKENLSDRIIKEDYDANPQYISILLRLGDILDIDGKRTPYNIYKLFDLDSVSDLEWKQHFDIDNTKKIFIDDKKNQKYIEFHGTSNDAKVHRKLLKYFDLINSELELSINLCNEFNSKYYLQLKDKIVDNIKTKGFNVSDFRLTLDYKAVTNLLMGEKIYGDKKYGLREIVQNSIDACKLMEEIKKTFLKKTGEEYRPQITVIFDESNYIVKVCDNGIGMTMDILKKYFLNIGLSYYSSNEFKYMDYDYKPIGNYGIGFLACFMLSDRVTVITKHYKSNNYGIEIEIEKSSEFITLTNNKDKIEHGTEIIMDYSSFMDVFQKKIHYVKQFIEENFLFGENQIKLIEITQNGNEIIYCKPKPELNGKVISLNKYLNGIEGEILIEAFNKEITNLEELTGEWPYDIFIYNEEKNILISYDDIQTNVKLSELIEDNKISYIKIPIIDSEIESTLDNLIDFGENDEDEAFSKIENDIDRYIYVFSKNFSKNFSKTQKINYINQRERVLFGDLLLKSFCEQFETCTYIYDHIENIEKKVIYKEGLESIFFLKENVKIGRESFADLIRSSQRFQRTYNKNVFLRNMEFIIPVISNIIEINSVIINLNHKHVIPNLSRDNINEDDVIKNIGYAIGKAIYLFLLDNSDLKENQKEIIKIFIEKYYKENNIFLKD